MEPLKCGHLGDLVKCPIWRCPHFRSYIIKKAYLGQNEVSLFRGCPLRGVPLYILCRPIPSPLDQTWSGDEDVAYPMSRRYAGWSSGSARSSSARSAIRDCTSIIRELRGGVEHVAMCFQVHLYYFKAGFIEIQNLALSRQSG